MKPLETPYNTLVNNMTFRCGSECDKYLSGVAVICSVFYVLHPGMWDPTIMRAIDL